MNESIEPIENLINVEHENQAEEELINCNSN